MFWLLYHQQEWCPLSLQKADPSSPKSKCTTKNYSQINEWFSLEKKLLLETVKLTNRFHVAVRLFSDRSQMTSKCKDKKGALEAQPSVSLIFLPHFDVLCDLLLNRRMATGILFFLYDKELKYTEKKPFYFKFCHFDRHENSTLTYSIVFTKWSELISCYAYQSIVIGSKNHPTVKLESSAVVIYASVLKQIISENQSEGVHNWAYYITIIISIKEVDEGEIIHVWKLQGWKSNDEGLTLETSVLLLSYRVNLNLNFSDSKFSCFTFSSMQHHSFFRNYVTL